MLTFTVEEFIERSTPAEIFLAACRLLTAAIIPEDVCPDCGGAPYNIFPIGKIKGVEVEKCYSCYHFWPVGERTAN